MKKQRVTSKKFIFPSEYAKIDKDWNNPNSPEMRMHSVHQYPAKFPSFIASKSFEYAKRHGVIVQTVGDVFCGCGTVGLESKLHGVDFYGFDISPVAVTIARAKSHTYSTATLRHFYSLIKESYICLDSQCLSPIQLQNQRIVYWFSTNQIVALAKIKNAIDEKIPPRSKYKDAFYCIFSSILKPCSRWLAKSIKPQIDPHKQEIDPFKLFAKQFDYFQKAVDEINSNIAEQGTRKSSIVIKRENVLVTRMHPKVDLIITSPPYVTSYEYADLHQLSTLWLDFAADYRDLRNGTIGSSYGDAGADINKYKLNHVGKLVVSELENKKIEAAKIRAVARYYFDMEKASRRCYSLLKSGGMAIFVIGDTEFKKVKIRNCDHLWESLKKAGFSKINCWKREISGKTLSPFRDENGRFSKDKKQRQIYHEEYIVVGRKDSE